MLAKAFQSPAQPAAEKWSPQLLVRALSAVLVQPVSRLGANFLSATHSDWSRLTPEYIGDEAAACRCSPGNGASTVYPCSRIDFWIQPFVRASQDMEPATYPCFPRNGASIVSVFLNRQRQQLDRRTHRPDTHAAAAAEASAHLVLVHRRLVQHVLVGLLQYWWTAGATQGSNPAAFLVHCL